MHAHGSIQSSLVHLLCLLVLTACGASEKYLEPSGRAAFVPEESTDFSIYARESQHNILNILETARGNTAYLGGYTHAQVAEMRAPFQMLPSGESQCGGLQGGSSKGFLLIHGLTDSPYLLRNIAVSLHQRYPCALIRAVLLPGHGTVVGDTLDMKKEDWQRIVRYGVKSFQHVDRVHELYLVGFSTGTSLTIDYLKENPHDGQGDRADKIKGVVLLSTAVRAKSQYAFLAPLVSHLKDWESVYPERDAARYESFSFNAGAQFYTLTKHMLDPEYRVHLPMLMAVSADDATIDAKAAREFYCSSTDVQRKALLWYASIDQKINADIARSSALSCENILEVKPSSLARKYRTANIAHTAITMAPEDEHYGVQGRYHNCKEYDSADTATDFSRCQSEDDKTIFGEEKKVLQKEGVLGQLYFRRGTFNPDYARLMRKIACFVDEACPVEQLIE